MKLLLAQITANIMQKVLAVTICRDHNIKTEKTHVTRLSDHMHDCGYNPVTEVKTIQRLEHGGKYPEIEH